MMVCFGGACLHRGAMLGDAKARLDCPNDREKAFGLAVQGAVDDA
jgi:hypothetical protein